MAPSKSNLALKRLSRSQFGTSQFTYLAKLITISYLFFEIPNSQILKIIPLNLYSIFPNNTKSDEWNLRIRSCKAHSSNLQIPKLWKIPGPENLTIWRRWISIQFLNSKNFIILYTKKLGDTLSGKIFHVGTHFYGGGRRPQ